MFDFTSCPACGKELSVDDILELKCIIESAKKGEGIFARPGDCSITCPCGVGVLKKKKNEPKD